MYEVPLGSPTCNSDSDLLILIKVSTWLLEMLELGERVSKENMNMEIYVKLCKYMETLKVLSLDRHPLIFLKFAREQRYILRTSMNHTENFCYRSTNTTLQKDKQNKQFGTTSLHHSDSNL